MKTQNNEMDLAEWGLLILLSLLWGGSFFFVGLAVHVVPPFTLVALRVGLAAVALNFVLRFAGLRLPMDQKSLSAFFTMGLLNNMIPFVLIVWGQKHIASGLASIFNATTPLFTVVVAHYLTSDEKMTAKRIFGVVAGLAGVLVIIGPQALQGLGTNLMAQMAILTAALSYAFAGVYGRRFKVLGIPPMVTATGQLTASALLMIPLALAVDKPWLLSMPGIETWGAILSLALFSTALAYIVYFRILATAGATNVLLVTLLIPVSAILLGTVILGEQLLPKHFVGMGFIGLGLATIDGRVVGFLRQKLFPVKA